VAARTARSALNRTQADTSWPAGWFASRSVRRPRPRGGAEFCRTRRAIWHYVHAQHAFLGTPPSRPRVRRQPQLAGGDHPRCPRFDAPGTADLAQIELCPRDLSPGLLSAPPLAQISRGGPGLEQSRCSIRPPSWPPSAPPPTPHHTTPLPRQPLGLTRLGGEARRRGARSRRGRRSRSPRAARPAPAAGRPGRRGCRPAVSHRRSARPVPRRCWHRVRR
jgi:hypothetical protein